MREGRVTASALSLPGTQGSVGTTSSAQEAKVKNSWKWANPLISGNVCTKEWETKHTAPFSLWADATGLNATAEPSISRLWLCCGKRAGKALHHMLGKVLSSDTGEPVPGTVTNIQERLRMWDTSRRCCSPLLSSILSHRIWATVIRWDGYLSSLPRKNGLGKLTYRFLLPSAHLPSKTLKNFSLTTSRHLSACVSSFPDVCHVFGYAGELHVGGCLPILAWLWGGLWQNKPLLEDKFWCKWFLSLNFKMKGTSYHPTGSSSGSGSDTGIIWSTHPIISLSLFFFLLSLPPHTTLHSQAGIKFGLLECISFPSWSLICSLVPSEILSLPLL